MLVPTVVIGAELPMNVEHLSLSQAISAAIEHNHDIRLSALNVKSARAATVIANAAPNPNLSIQTANINPKQGIGSGNLRDKTMDTTIRLDQVIERGDKRELRTENATHLELASNADLLEARRQLKLNVGQSYYDLMAAQEKLAAAKETLSLSEATANAAQKKQKAGDIAGADLYRITVDALRAKNDVLQAEADLAKTRFALALLTGATARANGIYAADRWPDLQDISLNAIADKVVEQRADIRAAEARLDAAMSARKLAVASRTRDVSVGVQFEHWPTNDTNTQGSGNSVGVSLQIPLFTRYYYDGEIRAAEVAVDVAQENLDKIRDAAKNEIYRLLHDVQSSADRVHRYQQDLLTAAKQSADAAEFAFKNGATSVMDVLDARRIYRSTQLDAVTAQADYAKSLLAWRAATSEDEK